MDLWIPNNKNRLRTVLLGNVPTSKNLKKMLARPIPKVIEKMLDETHEDLAEIKDKYEELGVEVISYPVTNYIENTVNVRDCFIVIDDEMFVTRKLHYLEDLYSSVKNLNLVPSKKKNISTKTEPGGLGKSTNLEKPWAQMDIHIPDFLLKPSNYFKN